jgi:hypothetical protein
VTIAIFRQLFPLAAVVLFSGCSFFQQPPPLPRHAAVERSVSEEEFIGLVQDADIIYFPSEAATLTSRSEPAWKLLGALRGGGSSFAIGSDWTATEHARKNYLNEASQAGGQIFSLNDEDQFAADKIAAYFREHRNDKVLVFIRRERLGLGRGIPYLVAQQTKARQLILNPTKSSTTPRLLAGN